MGLTLNPPSDTLAPDAPLRQRKGHGRATLRDVARLAGVTAITVSRFLREPHRVAGETAQRIQDALRATGYVSNKQAGMLASVHSQMVAALIPNIANSIFGETVQGLAEGLQGSGHELLLVVTGYSMEREAEQLRALLGWSPSAIVLTGRHHSGAALALLEDARARGVPVIEMWDQQPREDGFAQVGFDHHEVGRAMARHLLEQGYDSLAHVDSGVAEDFRAHERAAGFAAAARQAGVRVELVHAPAGEAFDAGRQALNSLLASAPGRRPRAVAFANDPLACGALLQAQALGLSVPRDLAVMGFGDFPIGRQLTPAVTTIRPPRYEIGRETARLLREAWARPVAQYKPLSSRALAWTLCPRASTANGPVGG